MVLYGKNSVLERLKRNPNTIRKIFLQDNFNFPPVEKLIKANNIPTEVLTSSQLSKIKPSKNLQGIVAEVESFKHIPFDDLLSQPQLTIIFLDRIYDPQNLGAIIRLSACFGSLAIVLPDFEACEVNETVLHVASGGENYISVARVSNLSQAIILAKESGYWIVGADVSDEAENIHKVSLPFPLGLVIGSEGGGIRYGVQKQIDMKVRIPMKGAKLSFNAVIACAIFCYEIDKQRAQGNN